MVGEERVPVTARPGWVPPLSEAYEYVALVKEGIQI
ncbi:hypothetical protein J2S43_003462 [Catenuloplanes nepalensis]|uniref:Ribulose-1,5-bisphosphate carboxylase/oxygenase large subunit n=1 Tax=Catenuloplanes nepalensis TaxID=587533 RepID=A0ABT9MU62_9ACTN|nr:hypothetical protein [Catenuloplanes nepalensis]